MRGVLLVFGVALVVFFATWAYRVNYRTQEALARVDTLYDQIALERQTIAVLRAEWAYLNRPERLLALSEKHFSALKLMPLHPGHFDEISRISYPEPEVDPPISEDPLIDMLIAAAIEDIMAGDE